MQLELAAAVMILWALVMGVRWVIKNVKKR
jgi:hypothetical protein